MKNSLKKVCMIGLLSGLWSSIAFSADDYSGYDLTYNMNFEHKFIADGEKMAVSVDPMECVQFGLGFTKELTAALNDEEFTIHEDDEGLKDYVHYQACMLSLPVGNAMVKLFSTEEDLSEGVEIDKDAQIRMRPIASYDKSSKEEVRLNFTYFKQDKAYTLNMPLEACVNPHAEGYMAIKYDNDAKAVSLKGMDTKGEFFLLRSGACLMMATPYDLLKKAPSPVKTRARIGVNALSNS